MKGIVMKKLNEQSGQAAAVVRKDYNMSDFDLDSLEKSVRRTERDDFIFQLIIGVGQGAMYAIGFSSEAI
jgi:hypothetical protein